MSMQSHQRLVSSVQAPLAPLALLALLARRGLPLVAMPLPTLARRAPRSATPMFGGCMFAW